ncbi:hypothetical protein T492DRAFT_1056353 [Pavlovales sp. CCMP2436]|nr:hypothetical protein T492DRAFT_1056353 [Pavlovales sp. CCMP2436]
MGSGRSMVGRLRVRALPIPAGRARVWPSRHSATALAGADAIARAWPHDPRLAA